MKKSNGRAGLYVIVQFIVCSLYLLGVFKMVSMYYGDKNLPAYAIILAFVASAVVGVMTLLITMMPLRHEEYDTCLEGDELEDTP